MGVVTGRDRSIQFLLLMPHEHYMIKGSGRLSWMTLPTLFSRIEEYSRKKALQNLRDRRRLRTMKSQKDIIEEEKRE